MNRLVLCMFAEAVGLLPEKLFQKMLEASRAVPANFAGNPRQLFAAMKDGGRVGFTPVDWFNGDDDAALPLDREDIADLLDAARLDWSEKAELTEWQAQRFTEPMRHHRRWLSWRGPSDAKQQ